MGKVGEELDIDFVVSTGDNFYENGLTGTDDQAFEQSFTDIYTAKSLQKPWYLGNKLLACAFRHSSSCCNVFLFCYIQYTLLYTHVGHVLFFPLQFWETMTTGVMFLHSSAQSCKRLTAVSFA
jgi:hypothetical protein